MLIKFERFDRKTVITIYFGSVVITVAVPSEIRI